MKTEASSGPATIPGNYGQMQNWWPVGLQPGGQKIDGPSLANKAAGCAQITMADATQKVSFMIRIAVLFDNMFHPFVLWLLQRGQDAQRAR
jgi:hypothetical protein